jgi:4-hydroxybenzoate polyprenyltransferase
MTAFSIDIRKLSSGILNGIRYEFIYGGHLVSLGAPAYVLSVSMLMGIEPLKGLLLITYLMPLIVYNYNYFGEMDLDASTNPERVHYIKSKMAVYPYIIVAYILILVAALCLYTNWGLIEFAAILVIGGILFTVVLKDFTKKIPLFKNAYTALIWAFGGTFTLVFYMSLPVGWFFILVFAFMYMRSIANVIFFDLKDMEGDAARGLKTLPAMVGKKRTIRFLYVFNVIGFIPLLAGIYIGAIPVFGLALLPLMAYSFYYLRRAETAGDIELRAVSYTLADAEFLMWPVLLIMGQILLSI